MTNKEVLEGLRAGKIGVLGNNHYKIENDIMYYSYEILNNWYECSYSYNALNKLTLIESAPEKPTWWKHEYYVICDRNATPYAFITDENWDEYKSTGDILIKSTPCQADTIEEAVKILENIKGE